MVRISRDLKRVNDLFNLTQVLHYMVLIIYNYSDLSFNLHYTISFDGTNQTSLFLTIAHILSNNIWELWSTSCFIITKININDHISPETHQFRLSHITQLYFWQLLHNSMARLRVGEIVKCHNYADHIDNLLRNNTSKTTSLTKS